MSDNQVIPAEAVEAAAKAAFAQTYDASEWELVVIQTQARYMRDARTALEAAAPHMLAEAKADAWDEGKYAHDHYLFNRHQGVRRPENPYRSVE